MNDFFENLRPDVEKISEGLFLLPHYLIKKQDHFDQKIYNLIKQVTKTAPLRQMITPSGKKMAIAITNIGQYGWVSDQRGYGYSKSDPLTGKNWPAIPLYLSKIASDAAFLAGFEGFMPDSCLINRYEAGCKLGSHQDADEIDCTQPIVSISLGISAIFQNFGKSRSGKSLNIDLKHGDILVFGGAARSNFHGVKKIIRSEHSLTGEFRYNLTFRKAK
jgi:alkylated DNA repair protein (DNA oxidative demethylase)